MSELISNLNTIESCKLDIKSAIEAKGVSMSGVSFPDYASAIGSITTSFVTTTLSTTVNGTFTPGVGIDGFSQVVVEVPQSVTGFTSREYIEGAINLGSVIYDPSVSFVKDNLFIGNKTVTTVDLPQCITISNYAFSNCSNLVDISLPLCETIGSGAFWNCSNISSVNLPQCITLNSSAFLQCPKINYISLPNCKSIGEYAFNNCKQITEVDLPACERLSAAFGNASLITRVSLPKCIDLHETFSYCTSLSELSLPRVGQFGQYKTFKTPTMYLCKDVALIPLLTTNITFNGVTSIYVPSEIYSCFITAYGFSTYASLFVSVEQTGSEPLISFSNGMIYGSTVAFNSTILSILGISKTDITVLSLPHCEWISNYAGYNLNNWTNITEINLPVCSSVMMDFSDCTSLTTVNLPKCEYLPYSAFTSCTGLTTINLPNLSIVGTSMFYACINLSEVKLSVCSYIYEEAFRYCYSISIYLYSDSVCQLGRNALANTTPSIYVPSSLVDTYKAANNWSAYADRIFPIPE